MRRKPRVRSATALLSTAIGNGTIADLYAEESAAAAEMAEMAEALSVMRAAPTPAAAAPPESRAPVRVMEDAPVPPWKQVECPVCKAAPGAFCINAATHKERLRAGSARRAEEAAT